MKMMSLAHDAARRFAALVALSRQLDLPARPSLLDVGGYPGILAGLLREAHQGATVLTVDQVEAVMPDYRVADGAELPFSDGEFDAVFSADSFEHIPPARRAAFVGELLRVSRGPVILAAPFDHPAVRTIERQLNESHVVLTGQEHPWLHEHVAYGLPDLPETVGLFAEHRAVALVRNAPLLDWALWNWLQMARELSADFDTNWERLEAILRGLDERAAQEGRGLDFEVAGSADERGFLPYRWILVAQPPSAVRLPPLIELPVCDPSEASQCIAYSEMLRALIEASARQRQGEASRSDQINDRLKLALAGSEQHARDLQQQIDAMRSESRSKSAARPWKRFLGKRQQ